MDERPLRVLLIDDSEADAYLVSQALRETEFACELVHFREGEEAVAVLRAARVEPPDVILLDLYMPRSDGRDVLAALRGIASTSRTPIAIFTSEVPPELAKARLPFVHCVRKPLMLDDFIGTVGSTVRELASESGRVLENS